MGTEDTIRQNAELKRLEFLLGLVTKEDVVAWADDVIDRFESPPVLIYDVLLAGCRTDKELAALLRKLAGKTVGTEPHATAFQRLADFLRRGLDSGALSSDEAATRLYNAACRTCLRLPMKVALACDMFDDEFSLVRQGVLDRETIEHELVLFLIACSGDDLFPPSTRMRNPDAGEDLQGASAKRA
jgi:hypothetical protein